jgi:hypothetical protein
MKGATVWLEDPGFESPALFTSDAKAYTTRSTVLMEGQMLGNAILESNAEGVIEFTLPVFEGAYAIGELPPEPEPEKVVSSVSITAPSEAEANTQITVAASDQNGEPLASAAVYYYHDFSEALLAGYTNSEGELPITIPEEGAFIIQVNYQGITSQRAISVYAPEPEEEPAPEPPAEEPSQEPPAPGQKGLDLSMLLPVAAALLILAAFAVAGGWFFFLRKPKAPDHEKPFKERLKKFRRE